MNKTEERIPIFFSVDDRFVPCLVVALNSIVKNTNSRNTLEIHILYTELSQRSFDLLREFQSKRVSVQFDDCSDYLRAITDRLPIRDYYSKTTYYRLFIADMFPELDKVLYLDSDIIVLGDVADLYHHDIGDNILGASVDRVMKLPECKLYAEKALGIDANAYFNAGVLIINTKEFRHYEILEKFISMLSFVTFVVAQDQDYLNVICKDHVKIIKGVWDVETCVPVEFDESEFRIIHYNMANKPWHYKDAKYADYFWKYAKDTKVYDELVKEMENYPDSEKEKDEKVVPFILETCLKEVEKPDNYLKKMDALRNKDRVEIREKIETFEQEGKFDVDVENDPPSRMLMPDEVDYLQDKLSTKINAKIAFFAARQYLKRQIKNHKFYLKEIKGLENIVGLKSGAVITCNHFSSDDSFLIQLAYEEMARSNKELFHKKKFYRVIREGNYTNFQGFFGKLMKSCNTLPLSSNFKTMKQFIISVDFLLQQGNFILFYPEQSMWWNYRKPKPLKKGAFSFAANNRVPVIPVFITMRDSLEYKDDNGFPLQEYTIHIGKPILPDPDYTCDENAVKMMEENYQLWKSIYEETYGFALSYTTKEEVLEQKEMLKRVR